MRALPLPLAHGRRADAGEPACAYWWSRTRRSWLDAIARGLRGRGWPSTWLWTAAQALDKAAVSSYDVVVLDRDLPRLTATRCAGSWGPGGRGPPGSHPDAHGRRRVADRIDGLNLGADDYLAKPFAFGELVARVRALGRRGPPRPGRWC